MRIWKFLTISIWINLLFLTLSVFANGIERITVSVDKNYYKVFITLTHPTGLKVFKDTKRDLLVLKLNNHERFSKDYYSVIIKGDRGLITLLVKNPKLDVSRAVVKERYRNVYIFIPFKKRFSKYVVVIDPGHGGKDSGAVYYGVKEKELNLAVAKKLYTLLVKDGRFKVYLTRKGDYFVSLASRQKFAAKVGADLFISIHANAAPRNPKARGVEFYILSDKGKLQKFEDLDNHPEEAKDFFSESIVKNRLLRRGVLKTTLEITQDEGEELAQMLCESWLRTLGETIPCHGIYKRAFAVLKVPGIPTVLVEVGFMTNRRELELLKNPRVQWEIAKALYRGILEYFNLKPPPVPRKGRD